ncbi:glycoside hydrolase family 92 protein, partial [Vibrio sp. FNV 38]|nr:glycoside hydrolase family 92 protein [Vibrio sp. FNV 38]
MQGGRIVDGWTHDRHVFFSARFSVPFTACKTEGGDRWLLSFPEDVEELTVAVGLSSVDTDGAANNRRFEASLGFDEARAATRWRWAQELGRITIEGGTPAQRTTFYTALYHTMVTPDLQTDLDGRY